VLAGLTLSLKPDVISRQGGQGATAVSDGRLLALTASRGEIAYTGRKNGPCRRLCHGPSAAPSLRLTVTCLESLPRGGQAKAKAKEFVEQALKHPEARCDWLYDRA